MADYLYTSSGIIDHPGAVSVFHRWRQRVESMAGQRGVGPARERLKAAMSRWVRPTTARTVAPNGPAAKALGLARMAQALHDEHGYRRGDYLSTHAEDYVAPRDAVAAPYCDTGRAGLGLVTILRRRVYAKSSKWGPSTTATRFLVGRNEIGTFFAHAVPLSCCTVRAALDWIWSGRAGQIISRQGDIALIAGPGPKMPAALPDGHRVDGSHIVHATHPALPVPGPGQRIIVARRAAVRASHETRD